MPVAEKIKPLPSKDRLWEILEYDPSSGSFKWKERGQDEFVESGKFSAKTLHSRWNSVYAGKDAGSTRRDGYSCIMIDGVHYKKARLAWKMMTGEDPFIVDHINGDRGDDRFENLRDVTPMINARNLSLYTTNKSGFPGVEWHNRDLVWVAKIGAGGKQVHLGNFKTKEEAIAARVGAEVVLNYHANHGRDALPSMKGN